MILNISEAMPSVLEWPISHNFFAYSATLFRFINHTETSGLEMVKHKEKKGKQTIYFLSSKWLSSRNIRQSRVVIYEVSLCDFTLTEQIPAFLSFQYTFFRSFILWFTFLKFLSSLLPIKSKTFFHTFLNLPSSFYLRNSHKNSTTSTLVCNFTFLNKVMLSLNIENK
jgi:hypothetical protein